MSANNGASSRTIRDRLAAWAAAGALAAAAAAGGCAKQAPTLSQPPEPATAGPAQPPVETDPDKRVEALRAAAAEYNSLAARLPGASPQEDREVLRQVFAQLAQTLPLLNVSPAGGVFDHQLSVVNDTRTQLASRSADLSVDPIVDNGLRAVRNALVEAAQGSFYEQETLTAGLDQLNAKVEALDQFAGPTHPVAVADAARQAGAVITLMVDTWSARVSGAAPTTAPGATGAATAPATPGTPETPAAPAAPAAPATPEAPATPAPPPPAAPEAPATPAPEAPAAPAPAPAEAPAPAPAPAEPAPAPAPAEPAPAPAPAEPAPAPAPAEPAPEPAPAPAPPADANK